MYKQKDDILAAVTLQLMLVIIITLFNFYSVLCILQQSKQNEMEQFWKIFFNNRKQCFEVYKNQNQLSTIKKKQ